MKVETCAQVMASLVWSFLVPAFVRLNEPDQMLCLLSEFSESAFTPEFCTFDYDEIKVHFLIYKKVNTIDELEQ